MFLLLRLPSFLARESIEARERIARAFTPYFEARAHNEGSALVRARYEHSHEHGVPLEDIARSEVGGAIAILSNTSPATFWMQYHIYSDLVVLEDCRKELHNVVSAKTTTSTDGEKIRIRTIDLSQVKQSCPVLLSTLQEVLRFHTIGISARLVMEDHMLENKYLFKKGNTVLMPGPVQHTDTNTWGPNVNRFDYRRFLPENRRHNPVAFRGFGGGTTLCPGRHFASTEILAFTAMLILRFDITPVDGKWTHLTTNNAGMWETTPAPDTDIKVRISPRGVGNSDGKWRILVTDSNKAMPISAEDL
jgi:cytochrome P450